MVTYTTRNDLSKPEYTDAADIGVINTNMDTIDASFAKCNWAGTVSPTSGDDSGDGYSIGSLWYDTTGNTVWVAKSVGVGTAVWTQLYPQGSSAHTSTSAPSATDDVDAGYVIGSIWVKTDDDYAYICTDNTADNAVWKKFYKHDHGELLGLGDDDHSIYLLASGGRALTGNWDVGAFQVKALQFESDIATGSGAPLVVASAAKCTNLNADQLDGLDDTAFVKQTLADDKGDLVVASGADAWSIVSGKSITNGYVLTYNSSATNNMNWAVASGGASFWTAVPGSPTRTGDHTFTVTDASHANLYDYQLSKGTLLKWTEDAAPKIAMVTLASNTSDTDTFYICGDAMAKIDASSLKYCLMKAEYLEWIIPGVMADVDDFSRVQVMPVNAFGLQVEAFAKAKGATSGSDTFDIRSNNTSIMASTSTITFSYDLLDNLDSTGKYGVKTNVNYHASTIIAAGSYMTADCTGLATTPHTEVYLRLWYMPRYYYYRS